MPPLPVEVTQLLTPANFQHLADGLEHFVLSRISGEISDRVWRGIRRKFLPFLSDQDDLELIRKRLDRLDDFLDGFQRENSSLQDEQEREYLSHEQSENSSDPSFDDFIGRASHAAMTSPDDAMRMLLGRISALRSFVPTSSAQELLYRECLSLTERVSARQLWALTTVYMLTSHKMIPRSIERFEIDAFLDRSYYPVLAYLAHQPWDNYDLEYLAFLNATVKNQTYEMMEHPEGSRFRRALVPSSEPSTHAPGEHMNAKFLRLADEFDSEHGHTRRSIGPYRPTQVGLTLGEIVFQQLSDQLVKGT